MERKIINNRKRAYSFIGFINHNPPNGQITYAYNSTTGNLSSITTLNGRLAYTYDVSHRLTQIQAPSPLAGEGGGEGEKFAFTYDTSARRTKLTYPNRVTTTYSYDSAGRLTNLLTQYAELQNQGKKKPPILKLHTIDSFTYTHDKIGNRLSKTDTDTNTQYSYDTIYRLLQSIPTKLQGKDKEQENKLAPEGLNQGAEVFTYDPVGNRLTGPKDKLNYTYNEGNQLMSFLRKQESGEGEAIPKDKVEYTYDKNGNLTKRIELDDDGQIKKTTLYSYDYENRLIKVEIQKDDKLKIVTFAYDPFGRRLSKAVPREEIDDDDENDKDDEDRESPRTTYYVYDNEDIIMEYNHKGKVTARYVHGLGIDEPLAIEQKGKVYYYHADGLGSVVALTNGKGGIIQTYDYDSFGNPKKHGSKVKQPYAYTSREWDRETGLYYYRARYYDPTIGRFMGFDPLLHPTRGSPAKTLSCGNSLIKPPLANLLYTPSKLNPFVYVENRPTVLTDPYGLISTNCSCDFVRCQIIAFPNLYICYAKVFCDLCGYEVPGIELLGFYYLFPTSSAKFILTFRCNEFPPPSLGGGA